jgi:hypothetical protein
MLYLRKNSKLKMNLMTWLKKPSFDIVLSEVHNLLPLISRLAVSPPWKGLAENLCLQCQRSISGVSTLGHEETAQILNYGNICTVSVNFTMKA